MAAMFNELFRIWAYIFLGLCIMLTGFFVCWVAWHKYCAYMDKKEEEAELCKNWNPNGTTIDNRKLINAMKESRTVLNKYSDNYHTINTVDK